MRTKSFFITLLFLTIIFGCAKALGPGYVYQSGEMALERAADPNADDEVRQKETDKALALFLQIIDGGAPGEKWVNKAHFQVAEIYKSQFKWEDATTHYQKIVDTAPAGYLGGEARSEIANIRESRNIIEDNRRVHMNIPEEEKKNPESEGYRKGAEALLKIAAAYESLGNYKEAINHYSQMVEEFAANPSAPQAQFKIGNIYFYKLYDYTNDGGWGAFRKVKDKFPDSYEASQAKTLLLKAEKTLVEIKHDQEYVLKYRSEMAIEYKKRGRKLRQTEVYGAHTEQVAQTYINIARNWEQPPMKNFPNAIKAYEELVEELPMSKFIVADALYQIGRLYQADGQYEKAVNAYDRLFEDAPESTWRDESVYNQAVCYEAIREFTKAYRAYKGYMSLGKEFELYREAERKVRVYENDEDEDGFQYYEEQEAGTRDDDINDTPASPKGA